jgi:hypothetical protein
MGAGMLAKGWRLFALCLLMLAGCSGDGGYGELDLIDVTGTVTLDGAPLAGAKVRFEDASRSGSEAITDE